MPQRITKVLGLIALTGLSTFMSAQMDWKPAGPVYNAGRARNMIVDKTNSQVLYVGSASSGVFKSVDGGTNWAPINDQANIRNISYMAQSSDGTIYIATGEGFLRPGQKTKAQPGTGLYRLDESASPAALNLVVSSTSVGNVINRVACNPNNTTHIALATNLGIFVSTNGGGAFSLASGIPTGTAISGQDLKFDSNGILYCSLGSEAGTSTLTPSQVFKSTDASLSAFISITPTSSVLPDLNYGRIELAVAPSDNNVIYASCANKYVNPNSASLKGLYVSYDAGSTWALIIQGSPQLDPLSALGTSASGDYAQALAINPTNPHQLFFGSYLFYSWSRTNNSNTNPIGDWILLANPLAPNSQIYIHQNIHDIKIVPGNPILFYFITDAGVFRSVDLGPVMGNLYNNNTLTSFPSYQPFYKGLITGQFNSVSIERYPIGAGIGNTAPGSQVTPYSGFIGGTGGNGLTYFSGTYSLVTTELNYLNGEVYASEYSKILSNAAFATSGTGGIFRSSNIKTSTPNLVNINRYINALSKIAPDPFPFPNSALTTGTPFKLWENYGQIATTPDSVIFYNDTIPRYELSLSGIPDGAGVRELTTKTTFTFKTTRPNKFAIIDSVVIRTGTVALPVTNTSYTSVPTPFTASDKLTIYARTLPSNFSAHATPTVLSSAYQGPATAPVSFTLNPKTLEDNISVTFTAPPFATKTITQYPPTATGTNIIVADAATYYRVFATVFYKYKANDTVFVKDENISTRTMTYSAVLTSSLSWRYGGAGSSISTSITPAIPNPTYYLSPGTSSSPNPTFSIPPASPGAVTVYTISTRGTYSLDAVPVVYTVVAETNTGVTGPYVYSISPGNYTQTSDVFTVNPTTTTDYTLTQTGTNTLTQVTNSVVGTSTYVLNPGAVSQSGTVFAVSPSVTTVYTITGVSSNTLAGANTSISYTALAANATFSVGSTGIVLAPSNKPIKIKTHMSARLAFILNNTENTSGQDAIVVSKNPLSLNDPLSLVRVSQSGAYSDDATGLPTTSVVTISGKPTLLEWSKSGTEIYFATSTNNLYRVSHITTLQDLTPSSYSGKFYTDIFKYAAPINAAAPNPVSPYRTTLIGSFDRQITSISVSSDNKNVAVSFNTNTTGTTSTVMYNTNDVRTSNTSNISWTAKQGTLPSSVTITYCSLMEKDDSKKVFLGTDNGMYFTSDITSSSPNWVNVSDNSNSKLPNVQIFDIEQQTFAQWDSYNSGQIYVATNGRGVWTTGTYFAPYTVGVEEYTKPVQGKNMSLYPNPTNGNVNAIFTGVDGETAIIYIMDISGRVVQTENIGKLNAGEVNYSFETDKLNSGVYIVNISSNSGVKRVTKLVVTK